MVRSCSFCSHCGICVYFKDAKKAEYSLWNILNKRERLENDQWNILNQRQQEDLERASDMSLGIDLWIMMAKNCRYFNQVERVEKGPINGTTK